MNTFSKVPKVFNEEDNARLAREGKYGELLLHNIAFFWSVARDRSFYCPLSGEELLQQICVEFLRNAHNWNPDESKFTTYFDVMATRCMTRYINYWRSGKQCPFEPPVFESNELQEIVDPQDQEEVVVNRELQQTVLAALDQLEVIPRMVIRRRFFDQVTLNELAAQMEVSREWARQIQLRALQELRESPAIRQLLEEESQS